MSHTAYRRTAGLLVLLLVVTSMPSRVWLLGACPVCGGFHQPILVVHLGANFEDPTPFDNPDDDPPPSQHDDDRYLTGCQPPMPFSSTSNSPVRIELLASGEVIQDSEFLIASRSDFFLIRPPRS